MTWRAAGGLVLLVIAALASAGAAALGYAWGSSLLFYGGLLLLAALAGPVAYWAGRGRWPVAVPIAGMSVAIFVVGFIAAELVSRAVDAMRSRESVGAGYSYEEARKNPRAFLDFWDMHAEQAATIPFAMPDPTGRNPYVLAPGWRGKVYRSDISINQRGFRGREIAADKGGAFRIVALGESTTFGVTMWPEDRPWPEVLEALIARDLQCDAPVEVINGGVPGWTLKNNLDRLKGDVLPLAPDLILSYHGYNGFRYFFTGVRGMPFLAVPNVPSRPSRLLERAEKVWRLNDLRRRYDARVDVSAVRADVAQVPYAKLYESLVAIARRNGIELVLATFNMAVNDESPRDVVDFYGETFPEAESALIANRLHTRVLQEMPRRPGVHILDATPGIDGNHELFIDMVHFTQAGRDRLAESMLAGLRPILMQHPRLRCRPREKG